MTIAEHVTVFISIVVGIAVGDLLLSFHKMLRARRRVCWHWLPLLVALFALLLTVNYWWASFSWYAEVDQLSVAAFLPDLAQFVVLFLIVAASLPDEVPDQGLDLKEWYFENAGMYWSLAIVSLLLDIAIGGAREVGTAGSLVDVLRAKLNNVLVLPFLAVMIVVRRLWLHGIIMLLSFANMVWIAVALSLSQ